MLIGMTYNPASLLKITAINYNGGRAMTDVVADIGVGYDQGERASILLLVWVATFLFQSIFVSTIPQLLS